MKKQVPERMKVTIYVVDYAEINVGDYKMLMIDYLGSKDCDMIYPFI